MTECSCCNESLGELEQEITQKAVDDWVKTHGTGKLWYRLCAQCIMNKY